MPNRTILPLWFLDAQLSLSMYVQYWFYSPQTVSEIALLARFLPQSYILRNGCRKIDYASVPVSLSSLCVTRKKTTRKKKDRAKSRGRGAFRISRGHFFLAASFCVTHDELSERQITHSLMERLQNKKLFYVPVAVL